MKELTVGISAVVLFIVIVGLGIDRFNLRAEDPVVVLPKIKVTLIDKNDYACMVENLYFESRGEPIEGIRAVANVVLNRMKKEAKTACEIIRAPYQFSWYIPGVVYRMHDLAVLEKIQDIAINAMSNQEDNVDGATHFHNDQVKPYWSRKFTRTATIGRHTFYKE